MYIRYFMVSYFSLCIFSCIKIMEPRENDINDTRRSLSIAAYLIFTAVILLPLIFMTVICSRFDLMKIKEAKASFNTLILKIDKQNRFRLLVPLIYFLRRICIALFIAIPVDFPYIFLQYVLTLMITHLYVLYLVSYKPYQSPLYNNYILVSEMVYSAVLINLFMFCDATPDGELKLIASIIFIAGVSLLMFINVLLVITMIVKGK